MSKASGGTRYAHPGSVGAKVKDGVLIPVRTAYSRVERNIQNAINIWERNNWIQSRETSKVKPISFGNLENRVKNYLSSQNITLESDKLYMTMDKIRHSLRTYKQELGIGVSKQDLIDFPRKMSSMEVYFDGNKGDIIYTDRINKFILTPNYKVKKDTWIVQVSAKRLKGRFEDEFNEGNNMHKIEK